MTDLSEFREGAAHHRASSPSADQSQACPRSNTARDCDKPWQTRRESACCRRTASRSASPARNPAITAGRNTSSLLFKYATRSLLHPALDDNAAKAQASSDPSTQDAPSEPKHKSCLKQPFTAGATKPRRKSVTIVLEGEAKEPVLPVAPASPEKYASRRHPTEEEIIAHFYPSLKNMVLDLEDEDMCMGKPGALFFEVCKQGSFDRTVPYAVPDDESDMPFPSSSYAGSFHTKSSPRSFLNGIKKMFRRGGNSKSSDPLASGSHARDVVSDGYRQYSCDGGIVMF